MTSSADVIILGGGCAGLSLAVQLAECARYSERVVVLEQRSEYSRDRTWCGWSVDPHPFQSSVDHSWSRWRVALDGSETVHQSTRFSYEHLRADRFYDDAQRRIARSGSVELRLGISVERVLSRDLEGRVGARGSALHEVVTDDGALTAPVVVDTRPSGASMAQGAMLQHFLGHEITAADPVFDPSTVTLMDFDVSQDGAIHFMYVLPFSPTRALVESTVFSTELLPQTVYEERLERYLKARFGTRALAVHYVEQGVIPMGSVAEPDPSAARSGLYRAGAPGGAIKPSSGYGFHAIQRTTAALADQLVGKRPARKVRARSPLDGWLDEVFLSFLRQHPERGPEIFVRLFENVAPDVLVRFLMERPRLSDRLRVIHSMPKLEFMREGLRKALPESRRPAPGVAPR